MFREHYRPDDTDDAWTRDLTTRQMDDIRLHLSWELGMDTFGWSREKVAESIVNRYKKQGIFLFLKHVVVTDFANVGVTVQIVGQTKWEALMKIPTDLKFE